MPKHRRERIVCPCYKLSRLKLWWLASRSANTLAFSRYSRPANASQPTLTVSIFLLTSLYITHHSSCRQYQRSSSNQRSGRHISCKVSRLWDNRQILLEVLWLWTIFLFLGKEYSSHIICLYVFSCGLWEQKISLHRLKGLERREEKETVKRTQREFIHYAERKFLQRS